MSVLDFMEPYIDLKSLGLPLSKAFTALSKQSALVSYDLILLAIHPGRSGALAEQRRT